MEVREKKKIKKNLQGEPLVQVSAWIKQDTYKELREEGIKVNHLIELGWRAYKNNPQIITRVGLIEQKIDAMIARLNRQSERMYAIEEKIAGDKQP